jgi:hypothetical protein
VLGGSLFPTTNQWVREREVYGTLKSHSSPRKNQQITKSFDPELGNIVDVFEEHTLRAHSQLEFQKKNKDFEIFFTRFHK